MWEWPVVGLVFLAGVVFGCIGFRQYYAAVGGWQRSTLDFIYYTLQLTALEFNAFEQAVPWTLQVARFLLPAVAVYTGFKALLALFARQARESGVRLFSSGHTIICGLSQRGLALARKLRARGDRVVLVEKDDENPLIDTARDEGLTVLSGDATSETVLRRARVDRACNVVSVCHDDGLNAEIAFRARALAKGNPRLQCLCHVDRFRLRRLIAEHHTKGSAPAVRFFSVYEQGAEALLQLDPPFAGSNAHVAIVGAGRMGEALLLRLTRLWKERDNPSGERLRVTLVDQQAEGKRTYLASEYLELADAWELDPVECAVRDSGFMTGRFLDEDGRSQTLTRAYVCFDDDTLGLLAALRLDRLVRARGREVPIVVRTREEHGLAVLLPKVGTPGTADKTVRGFGLLEQTCGPELLRDRPAGEA